MANLSLHAARRKGRCPPRGEGKPKPQEGRPDTTSRRKGQPPHPEKAGPTPNPRRKGQLPHQKDKTNSHPKKDNPEQERATPLSPPPREGMANSPHLPRQEKPTPTMTNKGQTIAIAIAFSIGGLSWSGKTFKILNFQFSNLVSHEHQI